MSTGTTWTVKTVVVDYKVGGTAYISASLPVNATFTNVTDSGTGLEEVE